MSIEVPCPRSSSWEAAQLEFKAGSLVLALTTAAHGLTFGCECESHPPPGDHASVLSAFDHASVPLLGVASCPRLAKMSSPSGSSPTPPPLVLTQHSPIALWESPYPLNHFHLSTHTCLPLYSVPRKFRTMLDEFLQPQGPAQGLTETSMYLLIGLSE